MIETERLNLKSPHEVTGKDVSDYLGRNREFMKAYDPVREEEYYQETFQENLVREQRKDWDEKRGCRFYICRKENKEEIIGTISLNSIVWGAFCSCFMGYNLDGRYINQGYMTEATNRVVKFAFEDLKLHRIEGNIMPGNKASRAVVEKCGFVNEGISRKYLKINGVWEDHIHYVMLNEEMERVSD